MERLNLNVRYIYHSGFTVENERAMFVFDYFQGDIELPEQKKIFVFCSHGHPDHFNPQILEWRKKRPEIQYIFSSDIRPDETDAHIHFISPDEEITIEGVKIKAYGSTDLGVSFLVQSEGRKIFHAGDLNWWYWWDDTPEEMIIAEDSFKAEIAKIQGEAVDIAFFPVDSRLKEFYSLGAEYFIQQISPGCFVPMHYNDDLPAVQAFAAKMQSSASPILVFRQKGQLMNL